MNVLLNHPSKIEAFTTIFQSIRNLTQTINIQFNADRMYVQTMDSARISILEVCLAASWFGEYTCAQPVSLGINVQILHKILSTAKKDHSIRILYNTEEESDLLTVEMKTMQATNGSFDQQFTCPLVDLEEEVLTIPEIEYRAEMSMPSSIFSTMIQQLRGFGESLDIRCNETANTWTSTSQENNERMSVNIKMDDLDEFSIDEDAQMQMSFALTQLMYVSSYGKLAKNVYIKLHEDYPLRLDYPLPSDSSDSSQHTPDCMVRYYLAPKISDD